MSNIRSYLAVECNNVVCRSACANTLCSCLRTASCNYNTCPQQLPQPARQHDNQEFIRRSSCRGTRRNAHQFETRRETPDGYELQLLHERPEHRVQVLQDRRWRHEVAVVVAVLVVHAVAELRADAARLEDLARDETGFGASDSDLESSRGTTSSYFQKQPHAAQLVEPT
jgi:hypothetical protein